MDELVFCLINNNAKSPEAFDVTHWRMSCSYKFSYSFTVPDSILVADM